MTVSDYEYLKKGSYQGKQKGKEQYTWGYSLDFWDKPFAVSTNGDSMNIVREPQLQTETPAKIIRFKHSRQPWRPDTVIPIITEWMDRVKIEPNRIEIMTTHLDLCDILIDDKQPKWIKLVFAEDGYLAWVYGESEPKVFGRYTLVGDNTNIDLRNRIFNPKLLTCTTCPGEWRMILHEQWDRPALLKQDRYSALVMPLIPL